MSPERGYKEARRLLKKHFGNDILIASAYQQKALHWAPIRSEDGKALHDYALFLRECYNTIEDIEILEDMNNPSHLRAVVSKLPFKLKERWRSVTYDYHEHHNKRVKFKQLVDFIEKQAKIAVDPLFGDIQDQRLTKDKQFPARSTNYKSFSGPSHKSSFVTVAGTPERVECPDYSTYLCPSAKMCLFCKGEHNT